LLAVGLKAVGYDTDGRLLSHIYKTVNKGVKGFGGFHSHSHDGEVTQHRLTYAL
jgi:hypothetical protein